MNKKILTISLIALSLGLAVFGMSNTVFAQQNDGTIQNQAAIGAAVEPQVIHEQLAAGYGPGSNAETGICDGTGECDGTSSMDQDRLRQQLQDGTGANCTTEGICTGEGPGQGTGQQFGQGGQGMGAGQGMGTCAENSDCTMDQTRLRQQLQDGTCLNDDTGAQTGNRFGVGN